MDTYLLYKLLNREPVNLSYIIINHIHEAYKSKVTSLPYGLLIQKILEHNGVFADPNYDELIPLGPNDFLGERYLQGLGFRRGNDNRWELAREPRPRVEENIVGEEEGDEGEEEEPRVQGDTIESLRRELNEFRGSVLDQFNQVNTNINRAIALQEAQHEEMMRLFQQLNPRPPSE